VDRRIPTRIHQLSALDAVASLKSSAGGLAHTEVARRLQEFGRNAVQAIDRETLSLRLIREFTTFFSLILWVAAGLAFFAEWSDPGQDMAKVGYAIVTVIVVSGLFSFWQEYRVEQTLAALRKLLPPRYCARARSLGCLRSNWCRAISSTWSRAITSPRIAG
jgi:sodium/potassium-transporting ATPase subunit alpha